MLSSIGELFAITPNKLLQRRFNHEKGEYFPKLLQKWQYELNGNNIQNTNELESA